MSSKKNTGKDIDNPSVQQDLTADELAASLSRQISGEEDYAADMQADLDFDLDQTLDSDLSDVFDEEDLSDDGPDNLIQELQMAVDRELAGAEDQETQEDDLLDSLEEEEIPSREQETPLEERISEELAEETVPAEKPDTSESEQILNEEAPEEKASAEEKDSVEVPEEDTAVENAAVQEPEESSAEEIQTVQNTEEPAPVEEEAEEEAFDQEDTGVLDVSEGVLAMSDAPTEELPNLSGVSAAEPSAEQQTSSRAQKKEDKKRRKQEEAEARAREKQEAAEAKIREKQEAAEEKARRKQEARDLKKQKKAEKKARKKGRWKFVLLFLLVLIAAAAIVYMALSNRYKTVFFDGTVINGADCTGLTVEEAETVIERQQDDYELTLVFRDGSTEVITGDSIGFEYVSDGSVQDIKDSQVPVLWLTAFFEEYSYEATSASSFDAVSLTDAVTALEECNILNMTAPSDAYLSYNEETNTLEIVPETQGNTFDLSSLIAAVSDAVSNGETELNVEEAGLYQTPSRTSEDEDLIQQRDELNSVISASVTYTLPTGADKVLDADTLVTWLATDEAGNYYYDSDNWATNLGFYVQDLAQQVNTSETTADFTTHSGTVVSLDNYLQGWIIDEDAEETQLAEELSSHAVVTREPNYSQRAYSDENNGIGNTYVEIDLSSQYLWVIENGEVVMETSVVSGTMTASMYTPEGIYPLYGKQEGRYLRGTQYADGTYEYVSWVDYWMPFNGGIGLHDASWRTEFGGTTYIEGGSHGCVNLPSDFAAELYEWISVGTPVICYYSQGYTLAAE